MSSARQGLTIVGKFVGNAIAGPVGAMIGPAIGSERGMPLLPAESGRAVDLPDAKDRLSLAPHQAP